MKLFVSIFIIFLSVSGCHQKEHYQKHKDHYWKKKKIEQFNIMRPSDSKIFYYSFDDSGAQGVIHYDSIQIAYGAGGVTPQVELKGDEQILKRDTVGGLIRRISTLHLHGDRELVLQAWDPSEEITFFTKWTHKPKEFYGFTMVAKNFNDKQVSIEFTNDQKDTVLKIFNSLTYKKFIPPPNWGKDSVK